MSNTRAELEKASLDANEYEQQNIILREKVTDVLTKNDDLSKIVGELSRAYYRIKLAAEKIDELQNLLKIDDKQLEEKIQMTTGSIGEKLAQKLADKETSKKR